MPYNFDPVGALNEGRAAYQKRQDAEQQRKMNEQVFQERRQAANGKKYFKKISLAKQLSDAGDWIGLLNVSEQIGKISPEFAEGSKTMADNLANMDFDEVQAGINRAYTQGVEMNAIDPTKSDKYRQRAAKNRRPTKAEETDRQMEVLKNMPNATNEDKEYRRIYRQAMGGGGSSLYEMFANDPKLMSRGVEAMRLAELNKKGGQLEAKFNWDAKIKESVNLADATSKARGTALTDLGKQKAALPGIKEVFGKLNVLADEATWTLAGKARNEIAKQLGFSTKGGTARSTMISLVNNQILPMLRPIFGAQFTEREGDRLIAAMNDPDSTNDSRKATLSSFMGQVERNIQALEFELNPSLMDKGGLTPEEQAELQQLLSDPTLR
jgi:hypothetical protein